MDGARSSNEHDIVTFGKRPEQAPPGNSADLRTLEVGLSFHYPLKSLCRLHRSSVLPNWYAIVFLLTKQGLILAFFAAAKMRR